MLMQIGLIAGIISGAAAIGSSILKNVAVNKANVRNLRQSNLAYQREAQMIKEQNQYNSPKAQMERFKEAGLNQNLIYTRGEAGLQSNIARYNPPKINYDYEFPDFTRAISAYQEAKLKKVNTDVAGETLAIREAEKIISKAKAKWASMNEQSKAGILKMEMLSREASAIFNQEEMHQFFEVTGKYPDGSDKWTLKPEMMVLYQEFLDGKYSKGYTQNVNQDAQTRAINLQNEIKEFEKNFREKGGMFYTAGIKILEILIKFLGL